MLSKCRLIGGIGFICSTVLYILIPQPVIVTVYCSTCVLFLLSIFLELKVIYDEEAKKEGREES